MSFTSPGTALVRRPGPRLADGIVTHAVGGAVDLAVATAQWEQYVDVLRRHGWFIVEVPPADDCPDAVFVEDTMVVFHDLAVIGHPGASSRRGEVPGATATIAQLGLQVHRVTEPCTLDGGDVLKVGRTVYVGNSDRTNAAAIDFLSQVLTPRDWSVVTVPTRKVLHLKSAFTALPDGTLVGWPNAIDQPDLLPDLVAMPEESGAHVLDLGNGTVLMATDCPASADLVRARGFTVETVDIGEFVKLDGCVTCLSVRVRTPLAASAHRSDGKPGAGS